MLARWPESVKNFVKVFPHEYKRILKARAIEEKDIVVPTVLPQAVAVGERAR